MHRGTPSPKIWMHIGQPLVIMAAAAEFHLARLASSVVYWTCEFPLQRAHGKEARPLEANNLVGGRVVIWNGDEGRGVLESGSIPSVHGVTFPLFLYGHGWLPWAYSKRAIEV